MAKKGLNIFVGLNDQNFQRGITRVNKSLKRFGGKMQRIGSNLSTNITAPLALVGTASVKMALEFETSMTKIQTLVGATGQQMAQYEAGVKRISSTTAVASKDLADGLFFITSAGLEGQQALDALEVSAKAGAMGMGEMDSIANALTSVMTAYSGENMSAARAGDLLHETLKQGKFDAGQFMDKLGSVIPVAAAAGISMEELGAASATMSKLSGDAAGTLTSMKSLMMSLLKPSEQQKEILEGLGMSTDDLGAMMDESLLGTMQFLFDSLGDNNEALLTMFGSSKAVTGALSTMGLQADTYKEVLDGMQNSQGNINKGMETLENTAGFKLKKAFTQLQNAGIEIGNMLMPVVLKIVGGFQKLLRAFTNADSGTKKLITAGGLIAAAFGPVLFIIGKIFTFIGVVGLPLIAKIAVLAAIGTFIVKNWGKVKKVLVDVINYFIDLYNESMIFRGAIEFVVLAFKLLYARVMLFAKGGWALVKAFGENFVGLFSNIGKMVKGALTFNKKLFKEGFKGAGEALSDTFDPRKNPDLGKALREHGETVSSAVNTAVSNTLGDRDPVQLITEDDIDAGVDFLKDKGGKLVNTLKGLLGGGSNYESPEGFLPEIPIMSDPEEQEKVIAKIGKQHSKLLLAMKEGWTNWGENTTERIQNVANTFGQLSSMMQETSRLRMEAEMAQLDARQEREIRLINESGLSQEEKEKKILAIERAADAERKVLKMKAAKQNKKFQVFNAIIQTANAVTNALSSIPFPFNIAAATMMGIMGAAQISAINSTPLPALAEGGLAFGPTAALVGDNFNAQANPEVIAPLDKLQNMMGQGKVVVEGVIRGEDIYLSNERYNRRLSNF